MIHGHVCKVVFIISVILFTGCARTSSVAEDQTSGNPILWGRVLDASGEPVPNANVVLYTGLASFFFVGETRSDTHGEYRFQINGGARTLDESVNRSIYRMGLRLEHPNLPKPPGGLHWSGEVDSKPGTKRQVDFTLKNNEVQLFEHEV